MPSALGALGMYLETAIDLQNTKAVLIMTLLYHGFVGLFAGYFFTRLGAARAFMRADVNLVHGQGGPIMPSASADANEARGRAMEQSGQLTEAVTAYVNAYRIDNTRISSLLRAATIRSERLQQFDQAETLFRLAKLAGARSEALFGLASNEARRGRPEDALVLCKELLARDSAQYLTLIEADAVFEGMRSLPGYHESRDSYLRAAEHDTPKSDTEQV